MFTILHDQLNLPNFSAETNWKSRLRSRAGFSPCRDGPSDFEYCDEVGELTRYFQQMQHPYQRPDWLTSVLGDGNVPMYRLEVKCTPSQNATVAFYMSGAQYALAKRLRVTSTLPTEIYVIIRVSGLNALEDGSHHQPQWRAYLDPCTLSEQGVLNFAAPTYAVTAAR